MKILKKSFNIIGFQLNWWACVLGVQNGYTYLGPISMILFLIIHIAFTEKKWSEINFIITIGFLGAIVDTTFLLTSLITYQGLTFSYFAPFWIIAMWLGFSATINHSLAWLDGRWFFAFLLGAIFGPLSYIAGLKFGAVDFQISFIPIAILSGVWGIAVPFLFYLNRIFIIKK